MLPAECLCVERTYDANAQFDDATAALFHLLPSMTLRPFEKLTDVVATTIRKKLWTEEGAECLEMIPFEMQTESGTTQQNSLVARVLISIATHDVIAAATCSLLIDVDFPETPLFEKDPVYQQLQCAANDLVSVANIPKMDTVVLRISGVTSTFNLLAIECRMRSQSPTAELVGSPVDNFSSAYRNSAWVDDTTDMSATPEVDTEMTTPSLFCTSWQL